MLIPDKGNIEVNGKISALMELGAGFNLEFTGRENIIANAKIYGLAHDIEEKVNKIIEFSNIGKFIDSPIKNYSQGMYMRLAFALAVFIEPDIFLVDDILAVGDQEAQGKCIDKIFELKASGKTIILVSHDMNMIKKMCDRVILIQDGVVIKDDLPQKAISYYLEGVGEKAGIAVIEKDELRVVFNNGKLFLNYQDLLLANFLGGNFVADGFSGDRFSVEGLSWKVEKQINSTIKALAYLNKTELVKTITIKALDQEIFFEIENNNQKNNSYLDILFSSKYLQWDTLDNTGIFPYFSHKTRWYELDLHNYPKGVLGLNDNDSKGSMPKIVFKDLAQDSLIRLFNTGYDQELRALQVAYTEKATFSLNIFNIDKGYVDYFSFAKRDYFSQSSLESEDLSVFADAKAKKVKVFHKNKEITKLAGMHTAFLLSKVWHDGASADWKVEKENNGLSIELSWKHFQHKQKWHLSLRDNNIIWNVNSQPHKSFFLEALKFGVFLSDEYKNYFYSKRENPFPEKFNFWQDMLLEDSMPEILGVIGDNELPYVFLKNESRNPCVIQSSDNINSMRALQINLDDNNLENKNIVFSTELIVGDREVLNREYEKIEQSRTVEFGKSKVVVDIEKRRIRLHDNHREITASGALSSKFCCNDEWFIFSNAEWEVKKENGVLVLSLWYKKINLYQIITFYSQDNNLIFKIELQSRDEVILSEYVVNCELDNIYSAWESQKEKGSLDVVEFLGSAGLAEMKDCRISDILLRKGKAFSDLGFSVLRDPDRWTLDIGKHKSSKGLTSIFLSISLAILKGELLVNSKEKLCFEGRVSLVDDKFISNSRVRKTYSIKQGVLELAFDSGIISLEHRGKKLTSELGIYSAVSLGGEWIDSSRAYWEVKESNNKMLKATGYWNRIPVAQDWLIEIIDENRIAWQVKTQAFKDICRRLEQFNIMIPNEYKKWQIPNISKGEFSDDLAFFNNLCIPRFWLGVSDTIRVFSGNLPKIIFKETKNDNSFKASIENSENVYNSRRIQYQRKNDSGKASGKKISFEGVIEIES